MSFDPNDFIGHMTDDLCLLCGEKLYINRNEDRWCSCEQCHYGTEDYENVFSVFSSFSSARKKIKIAICGLACSGKTDVSKLLQNIYQDHKSIVVKFSDPHYKILEILGEKKHRLFMQDMSDITKKYFGKDVFIRIFDRKIQEIASDHDVIICDDLRYKLSFDYLKKNNWIILYIDADDKVRKERSDALGLEWNPKHNSEQCHLFKNETDYVIVNNGTKEALKNKTSDLIFKY